MTDLSVVIPTRNEAANLWFTLQSLRLQEDDGKLLDRVQVCVADNEPSKNEDGVAESHKILQETGLRPAWTDASQTKSPYHPRNEGARVASGRWLLFLDSHVVLCRGFLRHVLDVAIPSAAENSITHFPVSFGSPRLFAHYSLRLGSDFWGTWNPLPRGVTEPYRIAASGIWAILVNRDFYVHTLEGFNPNFSGYGGGEPYLDLKAWQLGGEVWMDPRVSGVHYSGRRAYSQQWSDRVRNFALAISVVSPPHMSSFSMAIAEKSRLPPVTIENLIQDGVRAGETEALRFRKRAKRTMSQLVKEWDSLGVPR